MSAPPRQALEREAGRAQAGGPRHRRSPRSPHYPCRAGGARRSGWEARGQAERERRNLGLLAASLGLRRALRGRRHRFATTVTAEPERAARSSESGQMVAAGARGRVQRRGSRRMLAQASRLCAPRGSRSQSPAAEGSPASRWEERRVRRQACWQRREPGITAAEALRLRSGGQLPGGWLLSTPGQSPAVGRRSGHSLQTPPRGGPDLSGVSGAQGARAQFGVTREHGAEGLPQKSRASKSGCHRSARHSHSHPSSLLWPLLSFLARSNSLCPLCRGTPVESQQRVLEDTQCSSQLDSEQGPGLVTGVPSA